jgi:hypothetical protein
MKKIYALCLCLLPLLVHAQQKVGNLTIFSEDGDKFFLVLNGEKQNDIAESNIRIEELPQPYYSAKIIFADASIPVITKSSLMITDADGTMMDVTYRIRKDKSNKAKLNAYSAIPVQDNFIAPSGMFVRHWGQPSPVQTGGIRQTTTTTTTNTMGASLNVPGMNVNINITDPTESHTTTTTTTTSSNIPQQQQSPTRGCNKYPMSGADFSAAKNTINESSFDETKLTTAKSIISNNCMSSDQVVQICNLFSFEESKLAFAKHAYRYCTDPNNYFKVNNVFSFSTSKEDLSEFISKD